MNHSELLGGHNGVQHMHPPLQDDAINHELYTTSKGRPRKSERSPWLVTSFGGAALLRVKPPGRAGGQGRQRLQELLGPLARDVVRWDI